MESIRARGQFNAEEVEGRAAGARRRLRGGGNYRLYRLQPSQNSTRINISPLLTQPIDDQTWRNHHTSYYLKKGDLVLVDESKGTVNDYVFVQVNHRREHLFLQIYDQVTERDPSLKDNLSSLVVAFETVLVEMNTYEMIQNAEDFRDLMIEKFPDWQQQHGLTKKELEQAMVMTGWVEKRDLVGLQKKRPKSAMKKGSETAAAEAQ
jgi:hypothetical protein